MGRTDALCEAVYLLSVYHADELRSLRVDEKKNRVIWYDVFRGDDIMKRTEWERWNFDIKKVRTAQERVEKRKQLMARENDKILREINRIKVKRDSARVHSYIVGYGSIVKLLDLQKWERIAESSEDFAGLQEIVMYALGLTDETYVQRCRDRISNLISKIR